MAKILAMPMPWCAIVSNSYWQPLQSGLKKVISSAWHSGQMGASTAGWTIGLGRMGILLNFECWYSSCWSAARLTGSGFQGAGLILTICFFGRTRKLVAAASSSSFVVATLRCSAWHTFTIRYFVDSRRRGRRRRSNCSAPVELTPVQVERTVVSKQVLWCACVAWHGWSDHCMWKFSAKLLIPLTVTGTQRFHIGTRKKWTHFSDFDFDFLIM